MSSDRRELGIEFISALGLAPDLFVEMAAGLDCRRIGIAPTPIAVMPGIAPWSLRDPTTLGRFRDALAANGVAVAIGEGFLLRPGVEVADMAADLDLMAEIGTPIVNVVSLDDDPDRAIARLAAFAALAGERALVATVEFMPGLAIGSLEAGLAAVAAVGRSDLRLLVDAMHLFRSGGTAAAVAAADPAAIGYIQLCDVPVNPPHDDYGREARLERLVPGEGDLPLADLVAALPPNVPVGIETPMLARAVAAGGPARGIGSALSATRALLAGAGVSAR